MVKVRDRALPAAVLIAAGLLTAPTAHADVLPPEVGAPCAADLDGAMTLLPDGTTYAACQQAGLGHSWVAAPIPFPPNDVWFSYGPAITLHGQGMRNPNLSSGSWTATPQHPETTCQVTQTTVVEAGVLATPEITQGEQGKPLTVLMQPRLFYAALSGDCLWVKD